MSNLASHLAAIGTEHEMKRGSDGDEKFVEKEGLRLGFSTYTLPTGAVLASMALRIGNADAIPEEAPDEEPSESPCSNRPVGGQV